MKRKLPLIICAGLIMLSTATAQQNQTFYLCSDPYEVLVVDSSDLKVMQYFLYTKPKGYSVANVPDYRDKYFPDVSKPPFFHIVNVLKGGGDTLLLRAFGEQTAGVISEKEIVWNGKHFQKMSSFEINNALCKAGFCQGKENQPNASQIKEFKEALYASDIEKLRKMINEGISVNFRLESAYIYNNYYFGVYFYDVPIVVYAAMNDKIELAKTLIILGADTNAATSSGSTIRSCIDYQKRMNSKTDYSQIEELLNSGQ